MRSRYLLWIFFILTALSIFINLPQAPAIKFLDKRISLANFPLKLGLDLQGGTQLVLVADMSKIEENSWDSALESAKNVIERRVNLYGVSEALVQTSKVGEERRILVELPGLKDASAAANL